MMLVNLYDTLFEKTLAMSWMGYELSYFCNMLYTDDGFWLVFHCNIH